MTTILSVNSAIDALQEVAGQDITVEGVLCFEFEDTSIDHFPKVGAARTGSNRADPSFKHLVERG